MIRRGLGAASDQHERFWQQRFEEDVKPRMLALTNIANRNNCTRDAITEKVPQLVARAESARVHFKSMPAKWQKTNAHLLAQLDRDVAAALAKVRTVCFPPRVNVDRVGLQQARLRRSAESARNLAWHRFAQGDCAAAASLVAESLSNVAALSAISEAGGDDPRDPRAVLMHRGGEAIFPDVSECFASRPVRRPQQESIFRPHLEMQGARRRRHRR